MVPLPSKDGESPYNLKVPCSMGQPGCPASKQRGRESNHFISVLFSEGGEGRIDIEKVLGLSMVGVMPGV